MRRQIVIRRYPIAKAVLVGKMPGKDQVMRLAPRLDLFRKGSAKKLRDQLAGAIFEGCADRTVSLQPPRLLPKILPVSRTVQLRKSLRERKRRQKLRLIREDSRDHRAEVFAELFGISLMGETDKRLHRLRV